MTPNEPPVLTDIERHQFRINAAGKDARAARQFRGSTTSMQLTAATKAIVTDTYCRAYADGFTAAVEYLKERGWGPKRAR